METLTFPKSVTQNFAQATRLEWLETNGLGGWASSTICNANTRRYHGLLVAATRPPVGRMVLLSKLDETVVSEGSWHELGCNQFPNAIHPQGHRFLKQFSKGLFPVMEYQVGEIRLQKTIAAVYGENTTLIVYEVLAAPRPFQMELRPFTASRDFHSLSHANDFFRKETTFQDHTLKIHMYDGTPEFFISVPGSRFKKHFEWYYRFEYPVERYRGLDYQEDLLCHGWFHCEMKAGDTLGIIVSTEHPGKRDALELLKKEKQRRFELLQKFSETPAFISTLILAADQFIVRREPRLRSVIAGYHWFADWGRDSMIALPGLCLATGRYDDAKRILSAFAGSISQGMLPNRFPDEGETPEYNTVDATLWFFIATYKYFLYTGDTPFVRRILLPILEEIIQWHDRGTRYNIHVDADGLLTAGAPGVQLTWMDAKVGDWVVTPRQGKAVEVNALWYNALKIFAELSRTFGNTRLHRAYGMRARRVKKRFNEIFWIEEKGYLYDYIDRECRDPAIRPNQLFAISLPFPLLNRKKAASILGVVNNHLFTPVGLRSLSPADPQYQPRYGGDQLSRDGAYHQGTVWSWLLGAYLSAHIWLYGDRGRKTAQRVLNGMEAHLREAGLGTLSEIFDGDPPHRPRGCIAQAWSVSELLRVYFEDLSGRRGRVEST